MLNLEYLAQLVEEHQADLSLPVAQFDIGGRAFTFNSRPSVMGVINLSPDSWYRESVCLSVESAVERGRVLAAQGADLVDLGAESTLGHAARVNELEQQSKLLPVVRELRKAGVMVSVETYSAEVARACLEAGANVLNLTGTMEGKAIYRLGAKHGAAVIICYVQGRHVREVGEFDLSRDPLSMMLEYFSREIELAERCGLEKIIVDPGLGFYYRNLQDSSLRVRHQMRVFLNTFRLQKLGYPICQALPHAFEFFREEVRCAEPFFAILAALGRTHLFRTHEVSRTLAVLKTLGAF